ncbi:dienelactone hydrolase [Pseudanabaena sp. lw0831]|uniref:dienelactone hydrolase family protein n=1 Tax=Pseudanabaena sp. lw0831 TaxID=1357935 RepID=UPI0019154F11|nr:dienelactone hydrolase family protein [Pseudanabaena sp. lw0831]GBO56035.1 dienelactone hydrolase [Pseudanabaena sp. lw0831]
MSTTKNFINNVGKTIQAELFDPSGTPNGGIIIIVYGTYGMLAPWGDGIRDYADELSKKGFISVIPDYFASTNTTSGFKNPTEIVLHRGNWEATLTDAVTYAKTIPGVQVSRVGFLGFSLGGHLCLRLRANAKVLVEFFAPEFDGLGANTNPTLQAQIHHGLADQLVPFHPNSDNIKNTLQRERTTVELFSYTGANHGFNGSDSDNTKARNESKNRTISFFEKHL